MVVVWLGFSEHFILSTCFDVEGGNVGSGYVLCGGRFVIILTVANIFFLSLEEILTSTVPRHPVAISINFSTMHVALTLPILHKLWQSGK